MDMVVQDKMTKLDIVVGSVNQVIDEIYIMLSRFNLKWVDQNILES